MERFGEMIERYKSKYADEREFNLELLELFADWTVTVKSEGGKEVVLLEPPKGQA